MSENNNRYAFVYSRMENNKYVVATYFLKGQSKVAFFNKNSKDVVVKENPVNSKELLLVPDAMDDEYIYYMCSPGSVEYVISMNLLDEPSKKILGNIKLSDNPIIVKYQFK